MNASDDEDWIASLAGHARNETRGAREGALLRRALLALPPRSVQGAEAPSVSAAREAELLRRAGQAGLRTSAALAWRRARWFALAASVALASVGIGWWARAPEATIAVRSAADAVVRLAADDPVLAQRRLLEQLAAAGMPAHGYEMLGRYGVDADLPRQLTAEQQAILSRYGLGVPHDRVLRVEFVMSGER